MVSGGVREPDIPLRFIRTRYERKVVTSGGGSVFYARNRTLGSREEFHSIFGPSTDKTSSYDRSIITRVRIHFPPINFYEALK